MSAVLGVIFMVVWFGLLAVLLGLAVAMPVVTTVSRRRR